MRNLSNVAKFFIVCAVVFCIGLALLIGGLAAGGVKGLEKVAKERDWISDGPGELTTDYIEAEDFDEIDVNGDADVIILSEKYYSDSRWMDEHNDLDVESMLADNGANSPEGGHVLVVRGSEIKAPDIKVEDGVLKIDSDKMNFSDGISLNFKNVPYTPVVYVFCSDKKLTEIKTDTFCGDVKVGGITVKKANIKSDSGDLNMYGVHSKAATVALNSGDVKLEGKLDGPTTVSATSGDVLLAGELLGDTDINVESGDVTIDTSLSQDEYKLDINTKSGDLTMDEGGEEKEEYESPSSLQRGEGPNSIKVDSTSGDVDISFNMEEV